MTSNMEDFVMRTENVAPLARALVGSLIFSTLSASVAIAQSQMAGSMNTGLSSQSAITSPYSVTPPFVTPMTPQYGVGQNPSPFLNSPAVTSMSPQTHGIDAVPRVSPSITAPLPGPSDADIVSGSTMSSQAGTSMSTQSQPPARSERAPASVAPALPMGARPAVPPAP